MCAVNFDTSKFKKKSKNYTDYVTATDEPIILQF